MVLRFMGCRASRWGGLGVLGCHIRLCGSCGVDMLRFCDSVVVSTMFHVKS